MKCLLIVVFITIPTVIGFFISENEVDKFIWNITAIQLNSCGGVIEEINGTICSPSFPDVYPLNETCIWKILAPPQHRIILNFTHFELEGDYQGCRYDTVYVGSKMADGEIRQHGIFCGSRLPPLIRSESNSLHIEFRSDNSVQKTGFMATFFTELGCEEDYGCEHYCIHSRHGYKCQCNAGYELHTDGKTCTESCGGVIEELVGIISTPSFPGIYPSNKTCIWKILVPPKYRIALNFTHFDLEGLSKDCKYDRVSIGSKMADDEIREHGLFCGSVLPPLIRSESNSLLIKFRSDDSYEKSGFRAIFYSELECKGEHGCDHYCINETEGYKCECRTGYELHTDGKKCKDTCGGMIEESNGAISSPFFPDQYPSNKKCIWEIIAPLENRIVLNFTQFDIEGDNKDCKHDHLEIESKMANKEIRKHGVFCGSRLPSIIRSDSNYLRIEFLSDNSVQKSGFKALFYTESECKGDHDCDHYCISTLEGYKCECRNGYELHTDSKKCKKSCGGVIEETNGTISSPSFPAIYPSNTTCIWEIIAPVNYRITVNFTHFDLEGYNKHCMHDTISIWSKMTDNKIRNHGNFCGSKLPPLITSVSNSLIITFSSDDSIQKSGFRAIFYTDFR